MADNSRVDIIVGALIKQDPAELQAQLDKISNKLKIKLNVDINDKVLGELNNFSKSIDKLNQAMEKQNETIKKNIIITEQLDGSTKTVVQNFKRNGEVIEQTTTKIKEQSTEFKNQKVIIESLAKSQENLASRTKYFKDGLPIGTTDVLKQGFKTTTINESEGNSTRTNIKDDYEKAISSAYKKQEDLLKNIYSIKEKIISLDKNANSQEIQQLQKIQNIQELRLTKTQNRVANNGNLVNQEKQIQLLSLETDLRDKLNLRQAQFNDKLSKQKMDLLHSEALQMNSNFDKQKENLIKTKSLLNSQKEEEKEKIYKTIDSLTKSIYDTETKLLKAGELEKKSLKEKLNLLKNQRAEEIKNKSSYGLNDPSKNNILYQKELEYINNYRNNVNKGKDNENLKEEQKRIDLINKREKSELSYWSNRRKEAAQSFTLENTELKKMSSYYKQQEKDAQSLADFKQKMLGGDGFKGELDIFAEKQKGNYDEKALSQIKKDVKELNIDTPDLTNKTKKLGTEFSSLKQQAAQSGNLISKMFENSIKFLRFYAVGGLLVGVVNALKDGIDYIIKMDDALTDLSKVVNMSAEQLNQMKDASISLAKELSVSSLEVMKSMAEFGRITKDQQEIIELTRTVGMAVNVTSMTAQEAAKALTTAMIAFGFSAKDSMAILDQWNEIQNNFRTSAEDLAEGIGKVGAAARQSGISITELEGYITSIVSATGVTGSEAGTMLKTSISRMFRIGEEGAEDAGKSEELLNSLGINIRKSATEFKSFDDIIKEVNSNWSKWDNITQQNVAQVIAGTHHYSKFMALMQNFNIALDATAKAQGSLGSSIEENQKYIDSISGRINQLKVAFEDLWNGLVNNDAMKATITFFKNLVTVIGELLTNQRTFENQLADFFGVFGIIGDAIFRGASVDKKKAQETKDYIKTIEELKKAVKTNDRDSNIIKTLEQDFKKLGLSTEKTKDLINKAYAAIAENKPTITPEIKENIKSFGELSSAVKSTVSDIKDLNDIQGDLANGNKLSADSMLDLITKFPELLDYITKTKDGYIIETEAIDLLKKSMIDKKIIAIETEAGITQIVKTALQERLNVYGIELESIKTLNDARIAFDKLNKNKPRTVENMADLYNDQTALNSIARLNSLKSMLKDGLKPDGSKNKKNKTEYTPSTEQQALKDLLDAEKISLQQYYDSLVELEKKEYSGYRKKSAKELETLLRSSNEKTAKKTENYLSLIGEQKSTKDSLTKDLADKISLLFDAAAQSLQPFQDRLKAVDEAISTLGDNETAKKQSLFGDKVKIANEEVTAIKSQIDKLDSTTDQAGKGTETFKNRMKDLKIQLDQAKISVKEFKSSLSDLVKQEAQNQLDNIEAVQSKVIEMIKSRYEEEERIKEEAHNKELKRLDDDLEAYQNYVNGRLKALDDANNKEDYENELASKQSEVQLIQNDINKYSLADDLESRNKVIDLEKQKSEKLKDIADFQLKHNRDAQKNNLQDSLTDYEKYIKDKQDKENKDYENFKEDLEKRSSSMNVMIEAKEVLMTGLIKDISGNMVLLTTAYETFENKFGSGMGVLGDKVKTDFKKKVDEAIVSVQNLQSVLGQLVGGNKGHDGNMSDEDYQTLTGLPAKWKDAQFKRDRSFNEAEKERFQQKMDEYHSQAEALRKKYGKTSGWMPTYHEGDFVGGKALDPRHEEIAKVLKGELMIPPLQLDKMVKNFSLNNIMSKISTPSFAGMSSGINLQFGNLINIEGNADKNMIPDLKNVANQAMEQLKKEFSKMGFTRGLK